MRLTSLHATVLGLTAAQAGSVEWTRRRGGGGGSGDGPAAFVACLGANACVRRERDECSLPQTRRNLHRPRSRAGELTMKDVRIVRAPEFVGTRLRNASGGQGTLARSPKAYWVKSRMGLDGEDMSFDELAEAMITTDKTLGVSKENRRARAKSLRHFSLARSPNLLTKKEEIQLGRKVQELLRWERVRNFLATRLGRRPTMAEWAVELAALDGAEEIERELKVMREARERMISCNLRLVLHIARKSFYSGGSGGLKVGLDDMIQDGTAGLVKAVERFNPEKGFRFSTYASWWVHQGIHLGLAESGRLVRLPMNMHTMVCRVIRLQSKLLEQLGREPTAEEIAIASGLGVDKVQRYLEVNRVEPMSLDAKAWTKNSNNDNHKAYKVEDAIDTKSNKEPLYDADVTLLRADVEIILSDLTAREAAVLRMRFGIGGLTPSTLESVGRRLCVTRERVRQIQVGALKKLRGTAPTHGGLYADREVRESPPRGEWKNKRQPSPNSLLLELVEQSRDLRVEEERAEEGLVGQLQGARLERRGVGQGEAGVVGRSSDSRGQLLDPRSQMLDPRFSGRRDEREGEGGEGRSRDRRLNGSRDYLEEEREGEGGEGQLRNPRFEGGRNLQEEDGVVVGQSRGARLNGRRRDQEEGAVDVGKPQGARLERGENEHGREEEEEERGVRRRALEANGGGTAASTAEGRRRTNGVINISARDREGETPPRNVFSSLQSA